jgi:hypothetical protein
MSPICQNNELLSPLYHPTNDLCAPFTSAWHRRDGHNEPVGNVRLSGKKGKIVVFISGFYYLVVLTRTLGTINPRNRFQIANHLHF